MLRGLPDLAKENYGNSDKSKITKHLILSKGDNFQYFTNSLNLKLISELVSSD